jgi:hypothetical protein
MKLNSFGVLVYRSRLSSSEALDVNIFRFHNFQSLLLMQTAAIFGRARSFLTHALTILTFSWSSPIFTRTRCGTGGFSGVFEAVARLRVQAWSEGLQAFNAGALFKSGAVLWYCALTSLAMTNAIDA